MEIKFMDGGELGTNNFYLNPQCPPTTGASAAGFTGTYYYNNTSYNTPNKAEIDPVDEFYFGVRLLFTNTDGCLVCMFRYNETTSITVTIQPTGYLSIGWLGYDTWGTWYGWATCSDFFFAKNRVYRIECRFKLNTWDGGTPNQDGIWQVKVNGLLIYSNLAIRTSLNNVATVNRALLAWTTTKTDDIIVTTGDWPGNVRIQGLIPNAVGSLTEWSPDTTGDNYTKVNEIPYSDTDYIYTNDAERVDLYGMSDLVEGTNPISDILGIQIHTRAAIAGYPDPEDIQIAIKSGSTTDYGTQHQCLDDLVYYWFRDVWSVNPDTTSAFTKSEINSLEVGIKSKARP